MSKVSVIIPCYNQGHYIDEAVESVLNQTFQDFEIIIVNDGSTDPFTIEKLQNYSHPKICILHTENQGLAAARNHGIQSSSGEYILPLDSDDKIYQEYLEMAIHILDTYPNIGIVYCNAEFFGDQTGRWELPTFSLETILAGNVIFCSAFFRRQDYDKTIGYNPNMQYGWEDWDFWISLLELGYKVYKIPTVQFYYRVRANSMVRQIDLEKERYLLKRIFLNHYQFYVEHWGSPILMYRQLHHQKFAQLFIDTGIGFNETQSISKPIHGQERTIEFDLGDYSDISNLRFDPANAPAAIHLVSIELLGMEGERYPITTYQTNACHQHGQNYIFDTHDPIITFASPAARLQKAVITLEYVALGNAAYPYIYHKQAQQIQQQAQQIQQQTQQYDEVIRRYEEKLSREIHSKTQLIQIQDDLIQTMENTLSWKITKPLRAIRNYPALKRWADRMFTMFRERNRP